MVRFYLGLGLLLLSSLVRAESCPYIAIQIGVTTIDVIRHHCGEPESTTQGAQVRRFTYDNFSVTTGLRENVVTQLRIHDPGYVDENGVSAGMMEAEFRSRFPHFEYNRNTARDPVSDNLYRFRNRRVSVITVR